MEKDIKLYELRMLITRQLNSFISKYTSNNIHKFVDISLNGCNHKQISTINNELIEHGFALDYYIDIKKSSGCYCNEVFKFQNIDSYGDMPNQLRIKW